MPIPKPTQGENKDDFLSRCMGNDKMNSEYPDEKQRAAVCNAQFSKDEPRTYDITAEIFAVGRWNGMEFSEQDLMDFANNFHRLKEFHRVPLKFGHNDEQPMTDGQPALGWVADVWYEKSTKKLMAKFEQVPEIVKKAIEYGRYKNVSIEADFGVEHKGSFYENVLSAVALLGADIPAVNTLQSLTAFMSKDGAGEYRFTKRQYFTAIKEESVMPKTVEELEALLEAEKAKSAKFSTDFDSLKKQNEELIESQKKEAFSRDKSTFSSDLDVLVKENKITPAQRDKLINSVTDQVSLEKAKFSADLLKENAVNKVNSDEQGRNDAEKRTHKDAGEELDHRVNKFCRDTNRSYREGIKVVAQEDPELYREYLSVTGE